MIKCCRPLKVQVYQLADPDFLAKQGWKAAERAKYRGMHGVKALEGEGREKQVCK